MDYMNYSDNFLDIINIVDSLTKKELLNICNGNFKDSPYVKYRKCLLIENNPVSFIEIYQLPNEEYNFIVLATKKEYRHKGYSCILYNKMISEFQNYEKYKFMWRVNKDNINSYNLALKLNFKKFNETDSKIELILK